MVERVYAGTEAFYTLAHREGRSWHFVQPPFDDGTVMDCETVEEARRLVEVLSDRPALQKAGLMVVKVEVVCPAR